MIRSLCIVHNILNSKSPASALEKSLLNELASRGYAITAYCASADGEESNNDTCLNYQAVAERKLGEKLTRYAKYLVPDLFNIPDIHYQLWGKKVQRIISESLHEEKFDYIHSFSHPSSCHLVAYELHKKSGIPWIATFWDSWTDYPMTKYRTSFFKNWNKELERRVAQSATIIVHNNENIAELWSKRYGEEIAQKIIVIPLNENFHREYDGQLSGENKEVLQISHIGTFYPFRSAKHIIEGVRFFVETYPNLRNRIQVNFAGRTLSSDVDKIKEYQLTDVFKLMGILSRDECEDVYAKSDILLATAEQSFEDYTFPSKIIKYFYYQKPILGVGRPTSVLYSELTGSGHQCVSPGHLKDFADYMYKAITDYKSVCQFDKNYWKKFAVENVAAQYVEVIEKIVKNQ